MNEEVTNTYYHATTRDAFFGILKDGKIKASIEGVVYVCKSAEDAFKFVYVRNAGKSSVVILPIQITDDMKVRETFDHSEEFFHCKCYGIKGDVPVSCIKLDDVYILSSKGGGKNNDGSRKIQNN